MWGVCKGGLTWRVKDLRGAAGLRQEDLARRVGNGGDSSFWLLVALWASFGLGYVYNEVRH